MSLDKRPTHDVKIKWRSWYRGTPPRRIRLQRPGWSGQHGWDDPQPWHCKPWVDGSTYGLELVYPFETECRVRAKNGECEFVGDFAAEKERHPVAFNNWDVPFSGFAPNHFGFTSSVDVQTEAGYGTMILPHPRFYTDRTGTVPCAVMGFLESDWWPRIFFVVFKAPADGQELVFRQGEPYATLLFLPKKVKYHIEPMSSVESSARAMLEDELTKNAKNIATERFVDSKGQPFDNKYKVLSGIARTNGVEAACRHMIHQQGMHTTLPRKLITGPGRRTRHARPKAA